MSAIIIECIVTGQVFSDATYENFIGTYNAGEGLYQVFVDEWLKPDSKVGVFAQLRKAVIKKMEIKKQGYQNKIERQSCDHERRKSFYIKNDKNSWIESRWHETLYWQTWVGTCHQQFNDARQYFSGLSRK